VGVLVVGLAKLTGLEQLLSGLMNWSCVVEDRSDERETVHSIGKLRHMLADSYSGNPGCNRTERTPDLGGSFGLGIPRLELAGATHEH
jgi:hypothetical protein